MKKDQFNVVKTKVDEIIIERSIEKVLKYFISILIFTAIFMCGFYIRNFYSTPISGDPANWGQFGDYIGGVLNPLLALTNLVVFIFLNNKIQRQEDRNTAENIRIQKVMSDENKQLNKDIAFMQMRREELHYFKTEMDNCIKLWNDSPDNKARAKLVFETFQEMQSRLSYLFPIILKSEHSKKFNYGLTDAFNIKNPPINWWDVKIIQSHYSNLVNILSREVISMEN